MRLAVDWDAHAESERATAAKMSDLHATSIEMVAQKGDSLIAINGQEVGTVQEAEDVAKEIGNSSELVTLTFSRKLGMGDSSGPEMTGIFDVTVRLNIMLKTKSRVLLLKIVNDRLKEFEPRMSVKDDVKALRSSSGEDAEGIMDAAGEEAETREEMNMRLRAELSEREEWLLTELSKLLLFREAFNRFDTDGDHTLSEVEVQKAFQWLKVECSKEEVATFVRAADTDGNEELDFQEFYSFVAGSSDTSDLKKELSIRAAQAVVAQHYQLHEAAMSREEWLLVYELVDVMDRLEEIERKMPEKKNMPQKKKMPEKEKALVAVERAVEVKKVAMQHYENAKHELSRVEHEKARLESMVRQRSKGETLEALKQDPQKKEAAMRALASPSAASPPVAAASSPASASTHGTKGDFTERFEDIGETHRSEDKQDETHRKKKEQRRSVYEAAALEGIGHFIEISKVDEKKDKRDQCKSGARERQLLAMLFGLKLVDWELPGGRLELDEVDTNAYCQVESAACEWGSSGVYRNRVTDTLKRKRSNVSPDRMGREKKDSLRNLTRSMTRVRERAQENVAGLAKLPNKLLKWTAEEKSFRLQIEMAGDSEPFSLIARVNTTTGETVLLNDRFLFLKSEQKHDHTVDSGGQRAEVRVAITIKGRTRHLERDELGNSMLQFIRNASLGKFKKKKETQKQDEDVEKGSPSFDTDNTWHLTASSVGIDKGHHMELHFTFAAPTRREAQRAADYINQQLHISDRDAKKNPDLEKKGAIKEMWVLSSSKNNDSWEELWGRKRKSGEEEKVKGVVKVKAEAFPKRGVKGFSELVRQKSHGKLIDKPYRALWWLSLLRVFFFPCRTRFS